MKRRRVSSDRSGGEEPRPVQTVLPSSAAMLLDSLQNTGLPDPSSPVVERDYFKAGVATERRVRDTLTSEQRMRIIYPPGFPFDARLTIPYTSIPSQYKITDNGDPTPNLLETEQESAGQFTARVNPLTGCSETTYFGSYTGNAEWDTHKGNSILSFRVFIEPAPAYKETDPFFIFDFFIKIPDGIVFDVSRPDHERQALVYLINDCLTYRCFPTGVGDYSKGWQQWNADPAGVFTRPTAANPDIKEPIIQCAINDGTKELFFYMNTQDDTKFQLHYQNSGSTFVIFDHPNSMTNRGGRWSGFGFPNPLISAPLTSQQSSSNAHRLHDEPYPPIGSAFTAGQIPSFTTYPLGGTLVVREPRILFSDYVDPIANPGEIVDQLTYNAYRLQTFNQFKYVTRGENRNRTTADTILDWTVGMTMFGYTRNVIGCGGRPPGLKDSRYWAHDSAEISFDRKLVPMVDKILSASGVIDPTTFGVDFKSFSLPSGDSGTWSVKPWGESTYDGVKFNPNINLSKNTSQMHLEVRSYNEYGEPLLVTGRSDQGTPLSRNLMAGEKIATLFPGDGTTNQWTDWNALAMPNILEEGKGVLSPFSTLYYPSLNPIYQLYKLGYRRGDFGSGAKAIIPDSNPGPGDTIFETFDFDLLYYDNRARMSSGDSIVHFFQNEMY